MTQSLFDKKKRGGYAAVMMTTSLVLLCSVGGLATDVGWAYHRRQKAQTAAQASSLAAASYAKSNGLICGAAGVVCQAVSTPCVTLNLSVSSLSVGCAYATQNGFTDGLNNVSVSMVSGSGTPPGSPGVNAEYWVQTTITENVFPMFSAVIGAHNKLNIQSIATSATVAGPAGGSIYVMGSGAGTVTTDGTLNLASGTDVWVNSTSSTAVQLQGHDNFSCSGGTRLHCAGGCQQGGYSTISPAPETSCAAKADPFANMPAPSLSAGCTYYWYNPNLYSGNVTLGPGTWCGDINIQGNANVTLLPGTYIITGTLTVNTTGTVTGNGVTIYKPTGACNMTNGTVNLSPPTSGVYKGVTIFHDRTNTSNCTLTCGASQKITGLVYAPASTVKHCGGSAASAPNQTIVCNKIAFTGGTNVQSGATTVYTALPGGLCR